MSPSNATDRFAGLLLGTAVGDALGLPAENLSAERIRRRWRGQWRMRFIFGRGMVSDDTEHTMMVARALLTDANNAKAFQRSLARKLQWWFAGLPAGVGLATAKACIKLWVQTLWEWPCSLPVMEQVAAVLADQQQSRQSNARVRYFWPGFLPRNLLFLAIVLAHGFRRMFPPY